MMRNKSPLRYPGGKTRACKILHAILLEHFSPETYEILLSPFFGGGSYEFYLQNHHHLEVIGNDKFTPLYQFWLQCKENKTVLCEKLREIRPLKKETFTNYRTSIMDLEDPLLQAVYYFAINRCSFSGATLSGGFSLEASNKRFTTSSIDRVENLDLSRVTFHNLDFTDFLHEFASLPKTFTFLDPPYYLERGSKLYGNKGDMHDSFDHLALSVILKSLEGIDWMMTYNNCKYIRDLYSDYIIINVNWKYGMNKNKESSEIVILSKKS